MYFFGKIIGVILGFKWGGFFGAIAGLILGSIADKKLYEMGSVNSSFFKKKTTRQALFMQTTFAVLGHLSKSKGRVTEEDIQLANQLMNQMQLDESHRKLAQEAQLHDSEKEVLYVVAEELGLSRMQFEQMLAMEIAARQFTQGGFYRQYQQGGNQQQGGYQYQQQGGYQQSSGPTLSDAYKVLGVSESDDRNAVKRAYRRLMNEHHPDKLVAKGLPPEMMEMAKEKAQQIQAAYDLICKVKGWK